MQSLGPWTEALPRIPVGYSYTTPNLPQEGLICQECGSFCNNEALLHIHIAAAHRTRAVEMNTSSFAQDAFLVGEVEEDDTSTDSTLQDASSKSAPDRPPTDPLDSDCGTATSHHETTVLSGFPCDQCSGVTFHTKRELDVHTLVMHSAVFPEPQRPVSSPSEVDDLAQPAMSIGSLLGFRPGPLVSDSESSRQSDPEEPPNDLSCIACAPSKRTPFPSQAALFSHLQEVHLRCPAKLVGVECSEGPFPSRALLTRHLQAAHRLCPDCPRPAFPQHAAVHRHIQRAHGRCSHCSRGAYASSKALANHVRAAHASQHLRVSQGAPAPPPSLPPPVLLESLREGAVYYVRDSDGLEYLAQITRLPTEEGQVQLQWVGFDCECLVSVTAIQAPADLTPGTLVQVDLGHEGDQLEQGELGDGEGPAGPWSVRVLATGATFSIRLENLLDVLPLRSRQPVVIEDEGQGRRRAELLAVDLAHRRCTVQTAAGVTVVSFDALRRVVDLRTGLYCAVAPPGDSAPYEAQIMEVLWEKGHCRVFREDTHEEVTIPFAWVEEAWRGDHILDERTVVVPASVPPSPLDMRVIPTDDVVSDSAPYKPAMRYPALPLEKPKPKPGRKQREPVKTPPSGSPSTVPYPTSAPAGPFPAAAGDRYPAPSYDYASYPAPAPGYPDSYFSAFYMHQGFPAPAGYPSPYSTAYAAYHGAYPSPTFPSPQPGIAAGRDRGRTGDPRWPGGKGEGTKGAKGWAPPEDRDYGAGWGNGGPQPHRMIDGRPYPDVVYDLAVQESQRTLPVMPPRLPRLAPVPHAAAIGAWVLKFARTLAPSQPQVEYRWQLRTFFEKVLRQHLENRALQVYTFGSSASGMMAATSELDLCLVWDNLYNCTLSPAKVKVLVRQGATALKAEGVPGTVIAILDDRFPFIRGSGGAVNFEISFSAYCGVRNSALIRQYVLRYPAVRPVGMVLVAWAKRWGLHGRNSGLSMYTLMLMLLHYLVRAGDIHTVSIQEQLPTIKDPCHYLPIPENLDPSKLGSQLLGFFHFYSEVFDYARHVVSIRTPYVVTRESKQWTGSGALAVEDPFETFLNTAQVITAAKWAAIKQAIDSAHRLLLEGKVDIIPPYPANGVQVTAAGTGRGHPGNQLLQRANGHAGMTPPFGYSQQPAGGGYVAPAAGYHGAPFAYANPLYTPPGYTYPHDAMYPNPAVYPSPSPAAYADHHGAPGAQRPLT